MKQILVSNHAVERWRERASQYANEGPREVAAALEESEEIPDGEPLPLAQREPGSRYFRHPRSGSCLVVRPADGGAVRVVTVLSGVMVVNFLNPKTKRARLERLSQQGDAPDAQDAPDDPDHEPSPGVPSMPRRPDRPTSPPPPRPAAAEPRPAAADDPWPEFADVFEERAWLLAERTRVDAELLRLRHRPLSDERLSLRRQATRLHDRLTDIKGAYRAAKQQRARQAEAAGELYQPDGTINYSVAIPLLLERSQRQAQEIAALQAELAALRDRAS